MGALTKRPLFILFCQQPKRRGECPPNAIIQSTPLRDIHASHSRKLTISVLTIPKFLFASLSLSLSHSYFRLFFFFLCFFPLYCSVSVTFDREATPSLTRTFPRDEQRVPSSRIFRFRSSAAHAIPCQSQGSALLNATSSTNRWRSLCVKCETPPLWFRNEMNARKKQQSPILKHYARSDPSLKT